MLPPLPHETHNVRFDSFGPADACAQFLTARYGLAFRAETEFGFYTVSCDGRPLTRQAEEVAQGFGAGFTSGWNYAQGASAAKSHRGQGPEL